MISIKSMDKKYKKEVKFIITSMLDDGEFWSGGIPQEIDNYLQKEKGFTEEEVNTIITRVMQLTNGICHKLEKYENWPYCGKIGEHYLNW